VTGALTGTGHSCSPTEAFLEHGQSSGPSIKTSNPKTLQSKTQTRSYSKAPEKRRWMRATWHTQGSQPSRCKAKRPAPGQKQSERLPTTYWLSGLTHKQTGICQVDEKSKGETPTTIRLSGLNHKRTRNSQAEEESKQGAIP
jgi:hypothetical protein